MLEFFAILSLILAAGIFGLILYWIIFLSFIRKYQVIPEVSSSDLSNNQILDQKQLGETTTDLSEAGMILTGDFCISNIKKQKEYVRILINENGTIVGCLYHRVFNDKIELVTAFVSRFEKGISVNTLNTTISSSCKPSKKVEIFRYPSCNPVALLEFHKNHIQKASGDGPCKLSNDDIINNMLNDWTLEMERKVECGVMTKSPDGQSYSYTVYGAIGLVGKALLRSLQGVRSEARDFDNKLKVKTHRSTLGQKWIPAILFAFGTNFITAILVSSFRGYKYWVALVCCCLVFTLLFGRIHNHILQSENRIRQSAINLEP